MIGPSMSSCEHTLNTLRYADRVKELGASDPSRQERAEITDLSGGFQEFIEERMYSGLLNVFSNTSNKGISEI